MTAASRSLVRLFPEFASGDRPVADWTKVISRARDGDPDPLEAVGFKGKADADLSRWDVSTDLFAVGVVLYELLCNGRHPYPEGKPMVGCEVIDPRTIRADIDERLAAFVRRACAAGRAERFATTAEMEVSLREIRAAL